ncbi:MAG: translation elongation factor Ts [Jiangellales bacterium]
MPSFTAADVKRLRELTGAGMLDCKNALTEADGDFDAAVEILRVKYAAKVDKKAAERTAGNGLVAREGGALVELKCETDFVAKNAEFQALAQRIAEHVATGTGPVDAAVVVGETLADGQSVGDAITGLAATIGEKLELGRVARLDGETVAYMHKRSSDLPPQVGVLVAYTGDGDSAAEVARGAAMQVAAMRPTYVTRDEIPADVVENERRIAESTAREEGKPEQALPKIVEGRLNGFFKEGVLLEQAAVQDSKRTVKALLDDAGVTVTGFARFEVGA